MVYINLVRRTVYPLLPEKPTMDNQKIHDSRLSNLERKSTVLSFLRSHSPPTSVGPTAVDGRKALPRRDGKVVPTYSFQFTGYQIREHVEYTVVLVETYAVLGRTVNQHYSFKTRYSMLESLDRKLGQLGLPPKKWFGNKSRDFIEKRRGELEDYLNRAARSPQPALVQFIRQIKMASYNAGLKEGFSIE